MKFELSRSKHLRDIRNKKLLFLALIFVERSKKLSAKTVCDVNVGQVKKSGKFKTVFFESTWRRNYGGLCGHNPRKNK